MEAAQSTFIMVAAKELSCLILRYVSDWLEKTRTTFFIQSEISIADARSISRAWYKLRLVSLCLVARVPYWLLTFFFFFSENCGVVN